MIKDRCFWVRPAMIKVEVVPTVERITVRVSLVVRFYPCEAESDYRRPGNSGNMFTTPVCPERRRHVGESSVLFG